jgi:trehalose 6-phosphate phosphatase
MQVITPSLDFKTFAARIKSAAERVLILDYDGTLAPFRVDPQKAVPYDGVLEVLRDVGKQPGTRIVLVSGRRAADLLTLLPLAPQPEIWGVHGWERMLPNGEIVEEQPEPRQQAALEQAFALARDIAPGETRIERKPASVAVHWRGLSPGPAEHIQSRLPSAWQPFTLQEKLELLPFDHGLELRATGRNKHHAVKVVLSRTAADAAVAYLGDDITDEDAFEAVKARGIAVLVRPEIRETQADVWLRPPEELLAFLRLWKTPG